MHLRCGRPRRRRRRASTPTLAWYLHHQRDSGIAWDFDPRNNLTLDERDIRQARANYYAMMSEVDAQVGRLLDALRASGADERTLVVFTSDHGEHLGDHWQFSKFCYFDQAFHVPLIVRDPRPEASYGCGRQVSAFTENVDVMPTVLEALGLETPPQCDGESLVPFLTGTAPARWRREAHFALDFRFVLDEPGSETLGLRPDQCALYALRGERYKYVHFTALPPLFFDLEEDPAELVDRAGDPAYRDRMLEYAPAHAELAHEPRRAPVRQHPADAGGGGRAETRARLNYRPSSRLGTSFLGKRTRCRPHAARPRGASRAKRQW